MDLEFEKYCKVDQSPRTVLPSSQHHAKHEKNRQKPKSSSRNNQLSLEAGFKEIKLRNYNRSVSCKTPPTKSTELALEREVLKRGSIYQSTEEKTSFKRFDSVKGRKKIEFSGSGVSPFSFSLLDSICGSDEEEEEEPSLEVRESCSSRSAERDKMLNSKLKSHEVVSPSTSGNILKDENYALQKSLSAKLALPHSPPHSQSDGSMESLMSQFIPIRKMLEPLPKPKSHQSLARLDNGEIRSSGPRNRTFRKSLLHDFSSAMPHTVYSAPCMTKDQEEIIPPCSPAHLHGDLKVEHKNGVPCFELSLSHSDNVLVAKTWKVEDALNWVYTFHSFPGRKKSKDSQMIGQMQVSCHLCLDMKVGGAFSNSMITKFVLYDIMHARNCLKPEESDLVCDVVETDASNQGLTTQAANAFQPWPSEDLHPGHEIATVVIQVPFEKRESLKHRSTEKFGSQVHLKLFDLSLDEQKPKGVNTMVNVAIPLGNHSLPICETKGPSSLLDRWRLGGGCDCGGWDMACPLVVFDNINTPCKEEQNSLLQNNQPFNLYLQGAKEKTPALTMKFTRKGRYSIDFHAQLSALQAFAICVSILHASEPSHAADQEKHKLLLQCSSKEEALVKDEVKILIEAVKEEEKNKEREKIIKAAEDHPRSFVLNPPFSPIARV